MFSETFVRSRDIVSKVSKIPKLSEHGTGSTSVTEKTSETNVRLLTAAENPFSSSSADGGRRAASGEQKQLAPIGTRGTTISCNSRCLSSRLPTMSSENRFRSSSQSVHDPVMVNKRST